MPATLCDNARLVFGSTLRHAVPASEVFPLLCPVRELEWLEYWSCDLTYSASGLAEPDCTFRTNLPTQGPMTWTCSRHEPPRRIEYVAMGPHHIMRLAVLLEDIPDGGSNSAWTRTFTALDEKGRARLKEMTKERIADHANMLGRMLNHYLDTGKPLWKSGR
ncbi:MAG: hypothetical protein V3573_14030 [Desulfovibrionaceae bacterium]